MTSMAPAEREKFKTDFINELRFKMRFKHDDGDLMLQVQAKTVELAEDFFRRVMGT